MIWLLLFIGLGLALAYRRASLRSAATLYAVLLLAYGAFGGSWVCFFVAGLLLALLLAVLLSVPLRQEWLSRPALEAMRRVLPPISDTERAALDAGTVWWDGELFGGHPRWSELFAIPSPRLTPEEQAFLDGPVAQFCWLCDEWRITTQDRDLTPEAWAFLKEQRFFGLIIPREYGGLGFSAQAHSAILNRIASSPGGLTAASIASVPNSLGPAELLLHYGTEAQKQHYLPRLARGEEVPCFGLTSPWAGSDAAAIPDQGVVTEGEWQGQRVLGMRLNFDKRYITLAPVATVVGLAFRLYDPEHRLGERVDLGISCALIPRDTPGLEIGARHWPLEAPFMNGPVRGKDVFVPLEFLIGGPKMAGQGWRMLMECLAVGRAISLPSNSAGQTALAALSSGAYARIRRQFNLPVGRFEAVQEQLGRLAALAYGAQALRQMTAQAVDLGERPSVPSAIAKYWCTEALQEAVKRAMDVHAGKGVMLGPRNWIARPYQGAPIGVTVEGANLLTRGMIIFGQGALRCHPYVRDEIAAVHEPNAAIALERFDALLWPHIGHVLQAAARSLLLALSGSRLVQAPGDAVERRACQRASRYSANLALLADVAMLLFGGQLKFRESLSARLGDLLSGLYVISAALRRYGCAGRASEDRVLLQILVDDQCLRMEQALDGVLRHLPNPLLRGLLRLLVFPLGRHARPPRDEVLQEAANALQQPGGLRLRLADGLDTDAAAPLGRLDALLAEVVAVEPLENTVLKAARSGRLQQVHPLQRVEEARVAGVLGEDEAGHLSAVLQRVAELCAVDEFDTTLQTPRAADRS